MKKLASETPFFADYSYQTGWQYKQSAVYSLVPFHQASESSFDVPVFTDARNSCDGPPRNWYATQYENVCFNKQ